MAGTTTTRKKRPTNAAFLKKAPSELHEGLAGYITETTGSEVSAQTVGLVQRLYPLYLKSPAVAKAREAAKAEREAEAARKKAEKDARLKERLAKIEEQRAKLLADLGLDGDLDTEGPEPEAATVIDASERFTDGSGVEVEDEDEETSEEATVEDDDDDEWDDDESDEEDF